MLIIIGTMNGCKKDEPPPPSPPITTPPSANFDYRLSKPFAPCTVIFTNTSTNATTFQWNFGNGTTSSSSNPSSFFSLAGTYSVKLTAEGVGGNNSTTKSINIPNPATKIEINKITLGALTTTPTGNFDFYFKVVNSNFVEVWRTGTISNFNSSQFPTTFTLTSSPSRFLNTNADYLVQVWRVGVTFDTRIGEAGFFPRLHNTGTTAYPDFFTFPSSTNGTGMIYDVTWIP